jgi:hypothetical protein
MPSKNSLQSSGLPLAGVLGCHYLFASSNRTALADRAEDADFETLVSEATGRKKSGTKLDMIRQLRLSCWARQTERLRIGRRKAVEEQAKRVSQLIFDNLVDEFERLMFSNKRQSL